MYQLSQLLSFSSSSPLSVLSEKTLLPTMRISLIFDGAPSVTVKVTLTRLRSSGVTVVTTSAP